MQIINYVDTNKSMKLKDITAHFSLSTSTLSEIMKNREKIEAECVSSDAVKRTRTVTHPDVDKAMFGLDKCLCGQIFELMDVCFYNKLSSFAYKFTQLTPHQYPPHELTGSKRDVALSVYIRLVVRRSEY